MELHPGLPRYERRHPRQGPKIRGKAMRRRSLQQRPLDLPDGLDRVRAELAAAGFTLRHWWTDPDGRCAVSLAQARA